MEFNEILWNIKIYCWKIITFGYFPHILFTLSVIVLVFSLFFLIGHRKFIEYSFREKLLFLKSFLFLFLQQKFYFLKFYFDEYLKFYNKQKIFVILSVIFVIICICVYIFWRMTQQE